MYYLKVYTGLLQTIHDDCNIIALCNAMAVAACSWQSHLEISFMLFQGLTSFAFYGTIARVWRSTQEAEEAPLLRVQVVNAARGFKSLLLRQLMRVSNLNSHCLDCRYLGLVFRCYCNAFMHSIAWTCPVHSGLKTQKSQPKNLNPRLLNPQSKFGITSFAFRNITPQILLAFCKQASHADALCYRKPYTHQRIGALMMLVPFRLSIICVHCPHSC